MTRAGTSRGAPRWRLGLLVLLLVASLGTVLVRSGGYEAALTRLHRATPPAPTVVLIVLDTVRADRLSLCGYERPTSPTLEALRDRGATFTCDAVAPGSWTLPSHASFFTGLEVPEHGTHFSGNGTSIRGLVIRPLPDHFSTLAEQFVAVGYQSAGISANPVLSAASGLHQGFQHWKSAPITGAWWGPAVVDEVRATLRSVDRATPLFLFVNIFDAHDPWATIPEGFAWLPERHEGLGYFRGSEPAEWEHYVTGAMSESEAAAFRRRLGDLYDFALHRADWTLGRVIEQIEAHGWADAGMRLVVVSDHGEFLGEHGLARHGRYLWDGNQRVPLLVLDSAGEIPLPARVSALDVFSLVRDGRLPDAPSLPHAVAYPDSLWSTRSGGKLGGSTSAAVWNGREKLIWRDGRVDRFDLAADPEESAPLPPADHPLRDALEALVERVQASAARVEEPSAELSEALRALGYGE